MSVLFAAPNVAEVLVHLKAADVFHGACPQRVHHYQLAALIQQKLDQMVTEEPCALNGIRLEPLLVKRVSQVTYTGDDCDHLGGRKHANVHGD